MIFLLALSFVTESAAVDKVSIPDSSRCISIELVQEAGRDLSLAGKGLLFGFICIFYGASAEQRYPVLLLGVGSYLFSYYLIAKAGDKLREAVTVNENINPSRR